MLLCLSALKSKMETMRKEGGDKWLALFNAEREQQQQLKVWLMSSLQLCLDHLSLQLSPQKKRKSKSSKKKMRESNYSEKLVIKTYHVVE